MARLYPIKSNIIESFISLRLCGPISGQVDSDAIDDEDGPSFEEDSVGPDGPDMDGPILEYVGIEEIPAEVFCDAPVGTVEPVAFGSVS